MKNKNLLTNPFLIGMFLAMPFTACSSDKPGSWDSPNPLVRLTSVPNGDFEKSLENWSVTDGASSMVSIGNDGCSGSKALKLTLDGGKNIAVSQSVSNMENGFYDLEFYAKDSGGKHVSYISANGRMTALESSANVWKPW